ncbi:hypothetical protein [Streptomyces sp. NPDC007905]|uniref:hypothetical protein n=1 Tax=Streptomyces sp. NPDC007905 TaxID=3364788 RepID=UPI0036EE7083
MGTMKHMGVQRDGAKDYLYYATDWIWPRNHDAHIKSLLLFFDGVALSLSTDLAADVLDRSPDLAQPLHDKGLLINLDPAAHLSADAANRLASGLTEWLERQPDPRSSLLPPLTWDPVPDAMPRMTGTLLDGHWGAGVLEAVRFERAMQRQGLAVPISGKLWLVSRNLRKVILLAYCRALHREVQASDITLQPVMVDHRQAPSWPMLPGDEQFRRSQNTQRVIKADWQQIGADLSAVPLDEVLDFRSQHGSDFRAYARGLRELVRAGNEMSDRQFAAAPLDRSTRIEQEAKELRKTLRGAFGRSSAGAALTLAGAAWTGTHGDDLLGALLAATGAGVAVTRPQRPETAYSYLFHIGKRF